MTPAWLARALCCMTFALAALSGCEAASEGGAEIIDEGGSGATTSDSASTGEASGGELEFESLIDHTLWVELDALSDPLADHRPAIVECSIAGWYLENNGVEVEVDTSQCNYLALSQPSLHAIEVGQQLRLGFYHFDLVAPEPAEAHLQVTVDDELVWDYPIPIPTNVELGKTPAAFVTEIFPAEFSAPAGARVVFHLHNHGQNTWALRELDVER